MMTTILHNRYILRTYCQGVVTTYGRKKKKTLLKTTGFKPFSKASHLEKS